MLGEKAKAMQRHGRSGARRAGSNHGRQGEGRSPGRSGVDRCGAEVEQYEISAYGTARAIAEQMDPNDLVKLLSKTLEEEEKADELLTELAKPLLEEAEQAGGQEEFAGKRA
jgi:Mn-containing catalase